MFDIIDKNCVGSRVGEVDEVYSQDWKAAKERSQSRREGKWVHDIIFNVDNIYANRHLTCYSILFMF